jgi:hypothetical protein
VEGAAVSDFFGDRLDRHRGQLEELLCAIDPLRFCEAVRGNPARFEIGWDVELTVQLELIKQP